MGVGDDRLREQRDTAWDALDEIHAALRGDSTDASKLDLIGAIIANGPLDTAPGGPREDECARLRGEVERLRGERAEIIAALRSAKYGVEGVDEIDAYDGAPTVVDCVRYLAEQRAREADAADRSERVIGDALRCLNGKGRCVDWPSSVVFGEQEDNR